MPLKLMCGIGDIVTCGDDVVIKVLSTGKRMQLEFVAPQSVRIIHIHADSSRQFANAKKAAKEKPRVEPRGPLGDNDYENRGNR